MAFGRRYFRLGEGQIAPAFDGVDNDSAPDQLSQTRAQLLQNFLVDRPGRLPMRGPINASSIVLQGGTSRAIAFWPFNDKILVGYKAGATPPGIDPWVAPYRKAAAAGDLGSGLATVDHIDLTTGTVTHLAAAGLDQMPTGRSARIGVNVYGFSYDAAATATENGGVLKRRQLMKWDGTAVLPTTQANAPQGGQDVIAHYQRLFVLGGRDNPSGAPTTIEQNTLYYSIIGGPTPDAAASWKDPVSGLVNKIIVESDDTNDFLVAAAKVGQNLLVLKRKSMHVLYGATSATYTLRQYSSSHGCIDPRSVCQWENGAFFMSEQGFMYFDGSQLTNTFDLPGGGGLHSTAQAAALAAVGDSGVDNGFAIATKLPNGYIALAIGTLSNTASASIVTFAGLYHVSRRAWVNFSSNALGAGGMPVGFGRGVNIPFLIDDNRLVRCDKITAPELAAPGEYGIDRLDSIFTFAPTPNTTFTGTGNSLKNTETGTEMFPGAGGTAFPIPAKWTSRLHPLASPLYKSSLHRFLVDYNFQVIGGSDESGATGSGWFVSLSNGIGSVLKAPYQLPIQGDPTTYAQRRRNVQDSFPETSDLQVTIEWKNTATQLKKADILGCEVEFEGGRQRRSE